MGLFAQLRQLSGLTRPAQPKFYVHQSRHPCARLCGAVASYVGEILDDLEAVLRKFARPRKELSDVGIDLLDTTKICLALHAITKDRSYRCIDYRSPLFPITQERADVLIRLGS